ncbi:DUF4105 domain-containing protein [Lysobacter sp. GX 14042]|uniref:DUF7844 domain-containing protein n=1 Tax=Lysobacter sp. GX 14042 TaxID=2907155 RepID=UPI001F394BA1|nr:DUF4105 domain-containing protein [Lysobacter sp. GX 14042]
MLAALLAASPVAASVLQLDARGAIGADTRAATRALLDEAEAKLPPVMRQAPPVTVRWSDRLPAHVAGRATPDALLLNAGLQSSLLADAPDAAAAVVRERLLATVIHELGHFHDRRARLARDPRLLDLAGWQERARKPGRERGNAFSDRSPDPYELDSPAEFVAVNLEHFLLDPQYACRRPAMHRHFASHFGWAPEAVECAPGIPYLDPVEEGGAALAVLDPARVYQVDYLLAEGNEEWMSRWGHSMLRLVICAPEREPGPECRLDLQHHRVLSFRAFVDDVQLSSWAGLTGGYPSRLFVLPLEQVVEEYTAVQLRGLRSLPLDLAPAEIAMLLERVGRLHWSYDGRYRFIGNNCAVETFKLLHDGVPRLAGERLAALTPTGLLSKLERRGIADGGVLDDAGEALRLGYRFESLEARFQQMLDVARQEFAGAADAGTPAPAAPFPATTPAGWFALDPREREPWLERGTPRAGAALLLLEHAARRRQVALARDWLKRRYLEGAVADPAVLEAVAAILDGLLEGGGLATRPALLLGGRPGYGLPQAAERREVASAAAARRRDMEALQASLEEQVMPLLDPPLAAGLAAVDANIAGLGERLRAQQRAAGGFVLP